MNLPENTRSGILMRIATLDGVQPAAIKELDAIMEQYFTDNDNVKSSMVGGEKTAADILNFVDTSIENVIMEEVKNENEDLHTKISDLMFVFDDLRSMDDRGVQTMLREISSDLLILALKGVDEEFQQKFLKNMSSRAAEMLVEDMEAKGPVKLSEVETAQKEILTIAKGLEEAGEITLGGGGGEEMV
jgi:flagellar motor switch protein FliG